jgi:hypothetical protein
VCDPHGWTVFIAKRKKVTTRRDLLLNVECVPEAVCSSSSSSIALTLIFGEVKPEKKSFDQNVQVYALVTIYLSIYIVFCPVIINMEVLSVVKYNILGSTLVP